MAALASLVVDLVACFSGIHSAGEGILLRLRSVLLGEQPTEKAQETRKHPRGPATELTGIPHSNLRLHWIGFDIIKLNQLQKKTPLRSVPNSGWLSNAPEATRDLIVEAPIR
jgi:hypothetical protein